MKRKSFSLTFFLLLFVPSLLKAQDRETKVRSDQSKIEEAGDWIYNDLNEGFRVAAETGKPLLVVMRCVPCEACAQLDEQVIKRDRTLKEIMSQFVCVRLIATNGMDLNLLQYDYDQSWAAIMMNADRTIYGRYGTRSHQTRSEDDVSVEGFADSLRIALDWHSNFRNDAKRFAGKQSLPVLISKPEQFPSFEGKYSDKLDYHGKVVQSCIHCHQIGEAVRLTYREAGKPMPENILYPYPNPKLFGMEMDPRSAATIRKVTKGSLAEHFGLKKNDRVIELDGQPILSVADMQWVLHHTTKSELPMLVARNSESIKVDIKLPEGWRMLDDIGWRVTSWDLRRMVTGGLKLDSIDIGEAKRRGIDSNKLALIVKHVGQYGDHAVAKHAGFLVGDIIVQVNQTTDAMTEGQLLGHLVQNTKRGDSINVVIDRDGKQMSLKLTMQ
jgi:serine protease Do